MKKLNIISKVVLMLLVALQVNNINANALNESNIEALAGKIIKSESGINYMAVQSLNAMSLISSFAPMNEDERLMTKQRIEYIGKLNNEEFTPELKEEFAKLRGFYDYDSYQNLRFMRANSLQSLVSDFPEINTMSTSDRVLLFETVAQKFDYSIFNSPEIVMKMSWSECMRKSVAFLGACLFPNASAILIAKFIGCFVVAETAEAAATAGAAEVVAPAVALADVNLCSWLVGLGSSAYAADCVYSYREHLNKCFKANPK